MTAHQKSPIRMCARTRIDDANDQNRIAALESEMKQVLNVLQ